MPPRVVGSERRANEGGETLVLEARRVRAGSRRDEPAPEENKVEHLFSLLGARDTIKLYRIVEGEAHYIKSLQVDDDLADNLEERIAQLAGGGTFSAKGFTRKEGKLHCLGVARIFVDSSIAPKKTEAEKAREAQVAAVGGGTSPTDMLAILERERRAARDEAREQARSSENIFAKVLEQQTVLIQTLLVQARQPAAVVAAPPAASSQDPAAYLDRMLGVAEKIGWAPPSATGGSTEHLSMTERVLTPPLTKLGERIGDRIADMMIPKPEAPKLAPAPELKQLQPPTTPAAISSPPSSSSSPAPKVDKPPPGSPPPTLPRGSKFMTPEAVADMRTRRGEPRRPPPAPPAPHALGQEKK